jgi:hypothetical protein
VASTKVVTFGAKPPIDDGCAVADAEISGAHRYYNALIEIERASFMKKAELRTRYLSGWQEIQTRIEVCEQEIESLRRQMKLRNADERRKRVTAEERTLLATAKAQLKQARLARKDLLAAVQSSPRYLAELEKLHEDLLEEKRTAYAAASCGWGTRLKIAQAVEGALTCTNPLTGKRMPRTPDKPPRFHRWNGDGLIAVQIQKGMLVGELLSCCDNRLRLEMLDSTLKRVRRGICWMRIGSDGRQPKWLKVPVYVHENIPADAQIMWAVLVRRQHGVRRKSDGKWHPYYEWTLQLTVRTAAVRRQPARSGYCGIDLNWRLLGDGRIRVASWQGDDGACGHIYLDPRRWIKCDDLQSIRGGKFHDTKLLLAKWLAEKEMPEEFAKLVVTLPQWRSAGRLCKAIDAWPGFAGDAAMLSILNSWRLSDAHLWQWHRAQEAKSQRYRLDLYRKLAAMLASRYRVLAVEDCDWRRLNRLPPVEKNESVNETARRNMRIAAVGSLRQCLTQSGAIVLPVKTKDSTRTCHVCGDIAKIDPESIMQTCPRGHAWDLDDNAALVLLARAKMVDEDPGTARVPEPDGPSDDPSSTSVKNGRWQRRKATRSQKRSQIESGNGHKSTSLAIPAQEG